ncbi:C-X-C motif chemokine 9-like [Clarias magur]|uniref:C-X-C motif chemokine 9-like n=1 Tax=Clarias magur TaxID=1594786 RepID=A0A8J4XKD6_CLAMG|nr:C-X-C motif chemokine 9-like [Clarias magur]
MKFTLGTFPALLVLGVWFHLTVQPAESQHIPNRCACLKTRNGILGPFSDFTVTLKRHGCTRDEIIVILQKESRKVCLSPHGPQGKRLLKCWHRKQKEGKDEKKCIKRLQPRHRNNSKMTKRQREQQDDGS